MAESHIILALICAVTLGCQSSLQEEEVETRVLGMKKRAESQSEHIRQQQGIIDTLENKLEKLEAASVAAEADFVGFSAYMTDGDHDVEPEEFIPFLGVESNYGNQYDPKESEFICPTAGLYFFTFTLYSSALQSETDYHISSGTLIVGERANVETFNKNSIAAGDIAMQGTNTAIVKCEREQSVWVASQYESNRSYGTDKARRSTFSGMRLLNLEREEHMTNKSCDH